MSKISRDLIGKTFGRLTVLKDTGKRSKSGGVFCICLCACGNEVEIRKTALYRKGTRSCGCLRVEWMRKDAGDVTRNSQYCFYKKGARDRGFSFSLTREEFAAIVCLSCYYCGSPPIKMNKYLRIDGTLRKAGKHPVSMETANRAWAALNGVDRKNSNIGYETNNCVPCCTKCNFSKGTMTTEEYVNRCRKVAAFQDSK